MASRKRLLLSGVSLVGALWASSQAQAQEAQAQRQAQGAAVQEVVVTARRQAERLRDVPISVQVISQKTLQAADVVQPIDLVKVAPGLSIQNNAQIRTYLVFSIRGEGETFGQNSPGVITYFADAPDFPVSFFDLSNVQVLKGAQGTLFGRNATGGAVLFTPTKPGETWSGYALTRVGDYDRRDFEAAVGGPILGDKVLFRIAYQGLRRDGYTHNIANNTTLDNENRSNVRVSLVLRPLPNLENYTLYQYDVVDEASGSSIVTHFIPNALNAGAVPYLPLLNPRQVDTPTVQKNYFRSSGVINTTTYTINPAFTLKNIFSYRVQGQDNMWNLTGTPFVVASIYNPYPAHQPRELTDEFQLLAKAGPASITSGLYYEHDQSPYSLGYLGLVYNFINLTNYLSTTGTSLAAYAQINYQVTSRLNLTGGVRVTQDHVTSQSQVETVFPGQPVPTGFVAPFPPLLAASFTEPTWTFAADYKVSNDLSAYATVRRGYKEGGFNATTSIPSEETFQPEFVTDYEIGAKSAWRVGGVDVRVNGDVFYDDYSNIQRTVNLPGVVTVIVTNNAASATLWGVDLDAAIRFSKYFDVGISYAHLDTKYDSYVDPTLGDLSKSKFPNAPADQLTVTPALHVPIPESAGTLTASASIYYQSITYSATDNAPNGNLQVDQDAEGSPIPAYTKVDLRLEWAKIYGSNLSAAFYVQNLTNALYIQGASDQLGVSGYTSAFYGPPRMYGLELKYTFGR